MEIRTLNIIKEPGLEWHILLKPVFSEYSTYVDCSTTSKVPPYPK